MPHGGLVDRDLDWRI